MHSITLEDTVNDLSKFQEDLRMYNSDVTKHFNCNFFAQKNILSNENHFEQIESILSIRDSLLQFKFHILNSGKNDISINMIWRLDGIISSFNVHRDNLIRDYSRQFASGMKDYLTKDLETYVSKNFSA